MGDIVDQKTVEEKQFFEEVEEDLKYKRLHALWSKYGKYFVSALAIALMCSVANILWTNYTKSKMEKLTDHYMEAIRSIENGDYESSLKQLDYLESQGNDGFRAMIRLQKAYVFELFHHKLTGKEDELKEKIYQTYASIHKDPNTPKFYKDMTSIIVVHGPFPQQYKSEIMKNLERLSMSNSGWHHLALEALMIQYGVEKNFGKMREVATQLKNDMKIPKGILERAEAVLEKLDADAFPVVIEKNKTENTKKIAPKTK